MNSLNLRVQTSEEISRVMRLTWYSKALEVRITNSTMQWLHVECRYNGLLEKVNGIYYCDLHIKSLKLFLKMFSFLSCTKAPLVIFFPLNPRKNRNIRKDWIGIILISCCFFHLLTFMFLSTSLSVEMGSKLLQMSFNKH